MTAIAKKKPLAVKLKIKARKNQYDWADELWYTNTITATLLHTLKAIIACSQLDRPTLEQINAARTRSISRFAQSDPITTRTLRNHIKKLEELKLITVFREQDCWYSRNAYTVNCPANKLVTSPQEHISPSLCSLSTYSRKRVLLGLEDEGELPPEILARRHIALSRNTKLHLDALAALAAEGVMEPDINLEAAHYFKLSTAFELQVSDKMLFLLEEKNNVSV